ncbi:MFS transporter [Arcobacter ellisii]|uniref:Major facilitator superfamily transporter n=2 Tax=Arcobacter ellisii TaxID=913109 RepID=A0ABM6YLX5_9BACT|nr:MFS transporter [Arcobacter ellisii]AXX95285.1 major facilitator superfamily transporter [Arcobacter ellisii]
MDVKQKRNLLIVFGILILIISMGIRQSFGMFAPSFIQIYDITRANFGLALAIQHLLFGLAQPFIGYLSDKYGYDKVLLVGSFLYTLGLFLVTVFSNVFGLYISVGLLVGLALSATTYVVVLGAIAKIVNPNKRGMVFGIATAAASFGMFIFIPITKNLLNHFELNIVFYIFCLFALIIGFLGFFMKTSQFDNNSNNIDNEESISKALYCSKTHSGYWRLNIGFFVCGFHVAFIMTHFPTYLKDGKIDSEIATYAFALIGLLNIFGSFLFGTLADKFSKRKLLTGLYFSRAFIFALLIIFPLTNTTALLFGILIGFVWLATVPLTSGLVAQIFGVKALATLYGIVFLFHQLGSFLGAWVGGIVYEKTGSYDTIWIACVFLSILAAIIHINMDDKKINYKSL